VKTIELREDLGIKKIMDFYEEFKSILNEEKEIILDFSRVRRLDLSVIQVLMAGQKHARNEQKEMKLKNVTQEVKNQLRIACMLKII